MQFLPRHGLRKLARTIMFGAISAFMLQGVMISVSQAAAAIGTLPEPAAILSGSLHYHGQLAGHVHDHGEVGAVGHVHDAPEDPDADSSSSWSIFGSSIAIPIVAALIPSPDLVGRVGLPSRVRADGVEPAALIRPPSTFSLA